MALHGWGQPMSLAHIAAELGIGATGLSLGDPRVRKLLGDQGAVYMSNAYGKSNGYSGTISIGNSGTTSGVYRPNATSGWVYGSFSNPTCLGAAILYMTWEVDRHGGASAGELSLNGSVGAKLSISLNGQTWNTSLDRGNGTYSFPWECSQYLENTPSPVNILIQRIA